MHADDKVLPAWAGTVCGLAGGTAQILVGHPFDTVKVRMQALGMKPAESLTKLYSGVTAPLLGVAACNAVLFGSHAAAKAFTNSEAASGAFAGACMALINCPIESLKVRAQTAKPSSPNPRLLFRGLGVTLIRDTPSFAVYFASYDYLKRNLDSTAIAGGLAGILAWIPAYPQDVLKSRLQSHSAKTISEAFRQGPLWRGFSICMLRAFPANAATFLTYEAVKRLLQDS